jgi:3-hydroxyisobutyrate dehydrogenase-like beta-hydroxyacid dehydrogenase
VIAGHPSSVSKIKPFTGVLGRAIIPVGPDVSKATLLKVAGNTMIMGIVEILAETLVLAEKSGLGKETFDEFIQLMFPQSPFALYSKRMISGEYAPVFPARPGFQIDLARKDCKHALDIAKKCETRLKVVEIMDENLRKAREIGGENMDIRYTL